MDYYRILNKFSNPFIIQWGLQGNTQYGIYDIYMPLSYAVKYMVLATDWASPNNSPYAKSIAIDYTSWTLSKFVAHFVDHQPRGFGWISVGF